MIGAVTWYGCSVYDPSLLLPAADSGSTLDAFVREAAPDARDAAVEAAPAACPEVFPPGKPTADDPSDAGSQSFVVAVRTIDLGVADAGLSASGIGYDLDRVYTCCEGGVESCKAAVTGATHCDDPDGRDNAGAHLFAALAGLDPGQFDTTTISQRLENGVYSILLQVLEYNGQANDTQVTAALYTSQGVEGDAGAAWNGSDSWTIDDAFVVSPDASPLLPTHFDANAWVADGTLVMHVNFPLSLGTSATSTFNINLTAGVVTGQLVPSGHGTYSLTNGIITGRWNVAQLLSSLQTLAVKGQTLCQGSTYYPFIKGEICQYADIMTDPTQDLTGSTCDGVSLAIALTADPARLGAVVPSPAGNSLCPPDAGPDDCTKKP